MASVATISRDSKYVFYLFAVIVLAFGSLSIYKEEMVLALVPGVILGLLLLLRDIKILYFGLFAILPFSVEVELGPLGTDLPSEPIMWALFGISILLGIINLKSISSRWATHPITIVLVAHVSWILIAALFSLTPIISFKFFIAKLWYVLPFYFLSFYMLKSEEDIYRLFRWASYMLCIAVSIVLVRHALEGFTFEASNPVVYPIFRNHVSYAAMIVTVLPYLWALWMKEKKWYQIAMMLLLVTGTYFSYTRAAYICIPIMMGAYFIFKYRLGKLALSLTAIGMVLLGSFLIQNNRYLKFAPDYNKTISHDDFSNLLEATYKLEDISTMERVYRWVAGGHMIAERPLIGYGPNGFYSHYKKFTLSGFETYVSHNPEKSGIHCYYLMTWVEQGVIGLLLFLALCIALFVIGEKALRKKDYIVAAALMSLVSICALLLINDLIETDKVGPFFFVNAAIIVIYDLKNKGKTITEHDT